MSTRTPLTIDDAVERVIRGDMSVNGAAKAIGMTPMSMSRRVQKHPDYALAKADGRIAARPENLPPEIDDLKSNPAILAVVRDGLSLDKAMALHPGAVPTKMSLSRWVRRAYPDHVYATKRGRPRKAVKEYG